jgi:hypothetical protein
MLPGCVSRGPDDERAVAEVLSRSEDVMVGGERPETGEARFRRFMEGLREIDREQASKAPALQGQTIHRRNRGGPEGGPDRPTSTNPPDD